MRIGISALTHELKQALEICVNEDMIQHIEIGIDNLDECDELNKYADKIKSLNLSVGLHLPMELNSCENISYIRDKWIDYIEEIKSRLNTIEIKYFNIHLGYAMSNRVSKNRNKYLDNSILFLNKIKDSTITIENTYSNNGDFSNLGNNAEDFEYIFNNLNNKEVFFCYDVGHDFIDKSNYIDKLHQNIKVIHISDNDGKQDSHIGIGKGMLNDYHLNKLLSMKSEYVVLEIRYDDLNMSINKIKESIYIK